MNSIFPTTRWPDDRFSSTANGGALILSTKIAASVWDLVARCIAVALAGKEALPPRPTLPRVPVHAPAGCMPVVRLADIPEPTRTFFEHNLRGSGAPSPGTAFLWDWQDFLGERAMTTSVDA